MYHYDNKASSTDPEEVMYIVNHTAFETWTTTFELIQNDINTREFDEKK